MNALHYVLINIIECHFFYEWVALFHVCCSKCVTVVASVLLICCYYWFLFSDSVAWYLNGTGSSAEKTVYEKCLPIKKDENKPPCKK